MKENSTEEDIKLLEEFSNENVLYGSMVGMTLEKYKDLQLSTEHILSDYKRVLKENEELKSNNEKYIIHLTDEQYKTVIENAQNDINQKWIQKVKDKIEEIDKIYNDIPEDEGNFAKAILIKEKQVLQELLEGRK